jgi:MarR family transcriptional regulator, organic hydroperoxide resistance regulator
MRTRTKLAEERLAHLVKEVGRTFDRALQMRLAEHEVSIGHWTFLRVLWTADGLTQRELSDEAGVMEPTTFAALKAMERRGYIVRRPVAGDRRKRQVFLTARGRALEAKLVPLAKDVNAIAARGVPAALVAATRRTLLALLHNLAVDEARPRSALRRVPSTRELGRLVERAADNVSAEALHRHRR